MITRDEGPLARAATPGPELYRYSVVPEGAPIAVVGIVHGFGEYGARYAHVMEAWAERRIASIAIDLRGHGRASGLRGHCDRFGDYIDDVRELERLTMEKKAPAFLFGHSLGGLVATSSVLARPEPWRGLLLSAPLIEIAVDVPLIKRLAGRVASRIWPTLALPSGLRGAEVTHDAALAAKYDADPLVFHIARARWFTEVHAAQRRAWERARSLTLPTYTVMGTADALSKFEAARAFFEATGSVDKTWETREGLFHEVLNEPEWRGIADRMGDWILARVPA